MIKRTSFFLLFSIIGGSVLNAQVAGKAGVNTENPTETLDVKGTMRIEELPKNKEGKIYNGESSKNKVFAATRNVVADDDGNLGYQSLSDEKVTGAVFANIRVETSSRPVVVRDTDYTLILDAPSVTLPDASSNKNRVLIICRKGVSNAGRVVSLTINSNNGIILPSLYPDKNSITITNGGFSGKDKSCMQFHSNGINWYSTLTYIN